MAARKNYTAAQIINGLRRAEVGLANGKPMKEVRAVKLGQIQEEGTTGAVALTGAG